MIDKSLRQIQEELPDPDDPPGNPRAKAARGRARRSGVKFTPRDLNPTNNPHVDRSIEQSKESNLSAFVDSLQQMVGGDVGMHYGSNVPGIFDADGMAWPIIDEIFLSPSMMSPRRTTGHEFGHIADYRNILPKDVERDTWQLIGDRLEAQGRKRPWTPRQKSEYVAGSFDRAVNALQSSHRLGVRSVHEATVRFNMLPEDVRVLEYMLTTDIYENHHLNTGDHAPRDAATDTWFRNRAPDERKQLEVGIGVPER